MTSRPCSLAAVATRRPHLGGELLVRRDPLHEPVRQPDQQDRADERRPERRAEVLGGALEAAGLVRLRGWRRRDDHVPELRCEQPGPDAEHRESDQEADVVQLDVEGREQDDRGERDRHQAEAAHGLRRSPGGNLRAGQRRDQHRHRHRQQAEAGLEGVEPEHDLEVDGQHEERPEQDQLLGAEGRQPGAQVDDPEQRGVEQSVATEPGEALLPGLEDEQEAEPGEDQERHHGEPERRDLATGDDRDHARHDEAPGAALEDGQHDDREAARREGGADDVEARRVRFGGRGLHALPE